LASSVINGHGCFQQITIFVGNTQGADYLALFRGLARGLFINLSQIELKAPDMLLTLQNPLFWDKKIRIAVLTLATFMALC
jgi:hypothetical protein